MRKDAKLGFAIGGVLLAVLIVYVIVVPSSDKHKKHVSDTVATNVPTGSGSGSSSADSTNVNQPAPDGAPSVASTTPPTTNPADTKFAGIAPAQPEAKNDASTAAADPFGNGSPVKAPDAATAGKSDSAQANASVPDWNALLAQGSSPAKVETPSRDANRLPFMAAVDTTSSTTISGGTGGASVGNGVSSSTPTAPTVNLPASSTDDATSAASTVTATPAVPASPLATITQPATQPTASRQHVVQHGETFSSIAAAAYGSANDYPYIMRANPSITPTKLRAGMRIVIPDIADAKSGAIAAAVTSGAPVHSAKAKIEAAIDASKQYKVQPGDNLYKISMKLYGNADKVDALYEANKAAIGEDPAKLKLGQLLELPTSPVASR